MSTVSCTIVVETTNIETGVVFDRYTRTSNVPESGGKVAMRQMLRRALDQRFQQGEKGPLTIIATVDGVLADSLKGLTKDDFRKVEDNLVKEHLGLRSMGK